MDRHVPRRATVALLRPRTPHQPAQKLCEEPVHMAPTSRADLAPPALPCPALPAPAPLTILSADWMLHRDTRASSTRAV